MIDRMIRYLRTPDWQRQHPWRRAVWQTLNSVGLTGIHALPVHPGWVDIREIDMPLHGLHAAYDGMRVVQISDLHYSPVVWSAYLRQLIALINELRPDLIVVTGDLITGGYRWARRIPRLLARLRSTHGVICTLGNHDYSMWGKSFAREADRRGDHLEEVLRDAGLIVLRNRHHRVEMPGSNGHDTLHIVGLDDLWTDRLDAEQAFRDLPPNAPVVCLNHNPVNARELLAYPWQWMLAGHTHGRAIGVSKVGKMLFAKRYRHYTGGLYALEGRHLYVNRGLSYGQRARHTCRPEISLFRVRVLPAGQDLEAS